MPSGVTVTPSKWPGRLIAGFIHVLVEVFRTFTNPGKLSFPTSDAYTYWPFGVIAMPVICPGSPSVVLTTVLVAVLITLNVSKLPTYT